MSYQYAPPPPPAVDPRPVKSRTVAIVLALFLGGVGAHRFYLRQPGLGVLYLLLCWTFVPAAVAVVEAMVYLVQTDHKWASKRGFALPPRVVRRHEDPDRRGPAGFVAIEL